MKQKIKIAFHPTLLSFALTSECNLSCPFCWRNQKTLNKKNLKSAPDELVDQWLDMIDDRLETVHPAGGGEPLLHPRFGDFIQKALDLQKTSPMGKPEIRFVTNGTLIGNWPILLKAFETGHIRVFISMESSNPERYKLFRVGGRLDIVKKNIRAIHKARVKTNNTLPRTDIIISTVLTRHNVQDVPGLIDFALSSGVDRVAFVKLRTNTNSPKRFEYKDSVLSSSQLRYLRNLIKEKGNSALSIDFRGFPGFPKNNRLPCEDVFRSARIMQSGDVFTCCLVRSSDAKVGNIYSEKLYDIWHSEKLNEARLKIISGKPASICKGCFHADSIPDQVGMLRQKYLLKP